MSFLYVTSGRRWTSPASERKRVVTPFLPIVNRIKLWLLCIPYWNNPILRLGGLAFKYADTMSTCLSNNLYCTASANKILWQNQMCKRFMVIHIEFLSIPLSQQQSLILFKSAIWFAFNCKNPLRIDNVSWFWSTNKYPSFVLN